MLSGESQLKPHIKAKHPGLKVPTLSVTKVTKRGTGSEPARGVVRVADPWEVLWGTRDRVFLRFDFARRKGRVRRVSSDSTISVELDL